MNQDKVQFFARLLASTAVMESPEWKAFEHAIQEEGESYFGKTEYHNRLQTNQVRQPIRLDVNGKMPAGTGAFFNVSNWPENRPNVYRRDKSIITDPNEIYPGSIVRALLKICGYGRGMPYPPGIRLQVEHVQKLADGPRLPSARSDGSELGVLPDDSDEAIFN
jgi:ssDNA-binding protein